MYINYIKKLKYYIKKGSKKVGRRDIYIVVTGLAQLQ